MDSGYIRKRLEENDLSYISPLYKSAFDLTVDVVDIKNKFFDKYQKIKASFICYTRDKKAVSFYGMIVQKVIYNGSEFYVGQSCDSMTHKEHGGKGLFVKLANDVYEYLKQEGVQFVFGFPNTTIYDLRIKKLRWQHVENINVYRKKVSTLPLAKVVKKAPLFKPLYNVFLKIILKKYKSDIPFFENSVVGQDVAGIKHDLDYFNYKQTNDKFVISINGIKLWIKMDGFLWVGDFETPSHEQFKSVLKTLEEIARFAGCSFIMFHFQESTPNDRLLKEFIPLHSTMPMGFMNLTENHVDKSFKFTGSDFDSW